MLTTFTSLLVILTAALAAPLVAAVVPHKSVPEVVFLLVFGALLGPYGLGAVQVTEGVSTMSELGLAFLFLIAGYEVNPREFATSLGRTAVGTWFVSLAIGFALVALTLRETPSSLHAIALAIALTTTAYGTLAPILKERGLMGTPMGQAVTAHGVSGEIFPILAVALLLSTRASWQSFLILIAFFLVAVVLAVVPARARRAGARLYTAIENLRDTMAQTLVRFVVVILLALVTLCSLFGLDVVLGAFVAGFVLRFIMPEGDTALERKLEVVGFGFFIPTFFVVSGSSINLAGVFANPGLLLGFVAMLTVARTIPVYISTFVSKETRSFGVLQRLNVALYSTMALPLIVAICNIATAGGFMTADTSSTLITAGALTVLVMPLVTSLTRTVVDAHPVAAIHDIMAHPAQRDQVIDTYRLIRQSARKRYRAVRDHSEAPASDQARASAEVLANFNAQRLALLAELRANELQQTADAAAADPEAWEHIAKERKERWEVMKRRGDEAWERVKQLGDREISEMSAHGERYLAERAQSARKARDFLKSVSSKHADLFGPDSATKMAEKPGGSKDDSKGDSRG